MYVYQQGKLYVQNEGRLVGVDVDSDRVYLLELETSNILDGAMYLTKDEVISKFGISKEVKYTFPSSKKVVKIDDTTSKVSNTPKVTRRRK